MCVGENKVIVNPHKGISIMIASSLRMGGSTLDDPREIASAVLPLLESRVEDTSIIPPGALKLMWSSGQVTSRSRLAPAEKPGRASPGPWHVPSFA